MISGALLTGLRRSVMRAIGLLNTTLMRVVGVIAPDGSDDTTCKSFGGSALRWRTSGKNSGPAGVGTPTVCCAVPAGLGGGWGRSLRRQGKTRTAKVEKTTTTVANRILSNLLIYPSLRF
jgi:hypothetical protein